MKFTIALFFCLPLFLSAQNTIGLPNVINYSKQNYKAGLQNWDFAQDKSGVIYIANNEGLLTYDGKNFKLLPLPNKTIVRSVALANTKIYVGAQDEIGYFEADNQGKLIYHSLINLIPTQERSFGDIWDIAFHNGNVFFRGAIKIFQLADNQIKIHTAPGEWAFMGSCSGKLYAHDYGSGLMEFENNKWKQVFSTGFNLLINNPVTGILPINENQSAITTLKTGIYILDNSKIEPFQSKNNPLFIKERIYSACQINADRIALATSNNGIYIINNQGDIIQKFSKQEGLQNKNVLSVFKDAQSNLWLGLDNGIDMVMYDSPLKHIVPLQQDGSGYTSLIYNNILYAGTSGGLFSVPLSAMKDLSFTIGKFSPVKNIEGQIWKLDTLFNKILLGCHEGAYIINGNSATKISQEPGFWNFAHYYNTTSNTQVVAAGNYNGRRLFNFSNNSFIPQQSIGGFKESSRFVAVDKTNTLWVSHPYHGVYKIYKNKNGNSSYTLYNNNNGLPSALNNHIYKIKSEVIVATEKGIYIYNNVKDSFEPSEYYTRILGNQSIRYVNEDKQGNLWFIHDKTLGVVDLSQSVPQTVYFPELTGKLLSGFEFIYPVNNNNVLIAAERGFFNINYEKYKNNIPVVKAQIRSVIINDKTDSLIFGGYTIKENNEQQILSINNNWKTLRFDFSSTLFGHEDNIEYSYRLKGFDDNWSEYTKITTKEYTNLSAGTYTFEVKARNNFSKESTPSSYTFKMLPPWYLTVWAKILYVIIFLAGNYILYQWLKRKFRNQRIKYEEEQKKIMYIHELERAKTESEMVVLRNEKLEAEINLKNSELASSAMHLVKKGELLTKMKSELSHVMKDSQNTVVGSEIKKLIRNLSDDDKMDEEWENFTRHFDQVHSNFIKSLKEKHPAITNSEVKLSAYLRMNLSTKEIAQLLNISVRGVEISRYRLRKKLQLPTEVSLFDYLIKIDS